MRVLISGSRGLVGSALTASLTAEGHQVVRLVHGEGRPEGDRIPWDPAAGTLDAGALEGMDAAVHLAGESLSGAWTKARKAAIVESRVAGTRLLSSALAGLSNPPKVLLSASATGYYGNRGDEVLTEESPSGAGFLAELCREWEAATQPVSAAGIRVVHPRFGMILSADGGALPTMLTPFRLGLGGRLGSGRQWMSWIALDDVVGGLQHALATEALQGPVNFGSPKPVTNAEFTRTLAGVLGRPAFLRVPATALRLALGDMADEVLLTSQRMQPAKLLQSGYAFRFPELEGALRHVLGR